MKGLSRFISGIIGTNQPLTRRFLSYSEAFGSMAEGRLADFEVSYDAEEGIFYVPITQEESFGFPADDVIEADVRVRFLGGGVIGAEKKRYVFVNDALSEAVI